MGVATQIDVRVIAKDGKYLGDDIGGALVTIHDVHTGELLARGTTSGGSGQQNLMDICVTRAEVLPVDEASVFGASLDLRQEFVGSSHSLPAFFRSPSEKPRSGEMSIEG